MKVIAHRGANRKARENTMEAFKIALNEGADRIELDIHLSADNKLVIFHDFVLKRSGTGGEALKICDSTYDVICTEAGFRLPCLSDVIREFGDAIELNIEIKPNCPETAEAVYILCRRAGMTKKVIISSFYDKPLIKINQMQQSEDFSVDQTNVFLAGLWESGNLYAKTRYFTFERFMMKLQLHIAHPYYDMVNDSFMKMAKKNDWTVFPWMGMRDEENGREKIWEKLKLLGVSGLCTNYPGELKAFLGKK